MLDMHKEEKKRKRRHQRNVMRRYRCKRHISNAEFQAKAAQRMGKIIAREAAQE